MLMKEHPVYTNYLITTNGDVISKNYHNTNKKGLLKNVLDRGYLYVGLYLNKKMYKKRIRIK